MTDKPWGGRFSVPTDEFVELYTASIDVDQRMASEDIRGSRVHARMLNKQNIISDEDLASILSGLDDIESQIARGEIEFTTALEDIHMNIEQRLTEKIGDAGKKLHTARSRNDQVATDFRLYLRGQLDALMVATRALQKALVQSASAHAGTVMPGFTHLQIAQPVTFGHHLLAYVEMLDRDAGRLHDAQVRMNQCPLGSAALAGTTFPIDREFVAKELGFDRPCANSLDAVSDRDFVLETLSALSIQAVHLSRLCEEFILWMSQAFSFVILGDAYCTGSSIMPQKKNPDVPELIRGKSGRIIGHLVSQLTLMKGLPLAYNKDMQEDKEAVFDACDQMRASLKIFAAMLPTMQVQTENMKAAAEQGFSTATDLADMLVREGVNFRDAHEIVGKAVALAVEKKIMLEQLDGADCALIDGRLKPEHVQQLSLQACVDARNHLGGTAPAQVKEQCRLWQERLSR